MSPKKILSFIIILFTLALLPKIFKSDKIFSDYRPYLGKIIVGINFSGNNYVESNDLYDIIKARPGLKLTKDILNHDIKAIFKNGSFSDVKIDAEFYSGTETDSELYKEGIILTYIVEERAYVKEVVFKGLDEVTEQEARDASNIKEDEIYSQSIVSNAIQNLRFLYEEKGFFNSSIRVNKEAVKEASGGWKIIFLIDEGEEIKISKIEILGSVNLDPEDIKDSLEHEEEGFFTDGSFKKELFEKDKENAINYMKGEGYLDSKLLNSDWKIVWIDKEEEERGIEITYTVEEGEQYFFNGYHIEWNKEYLNSETKKPLFTADDISSFFLYTNRDLGDVYDSNKINQDSGIINYIYSQQGYIFTRVVPKKTIIVLTKEDIDKRRKSPEQIASEKEGKDYYNLNALQILLNEEKEKKNKKFVHTKFVIYESEKGYIENIIIKGNDKTQRKVIYRELLFKEGQLFNSESIQRSRERVFNLGFFKEVNIDARPGSSEGKLNLLIVVEEQPTGNINLGGGYGTVNGFSIFTELAENNLNGTGQRIAGKMDFGPRRTLVEVSWREPWIFDRPWSLILSTSYSSTEIRNSSIAGPSTAASYVVDNISFAASIGHRFAIYWEHAHGLSPGLSRFRKPSSLVEDVVFSSVSRGWEFFHALSNSIAYDTRDNHFNTTQGMRAELRLIMVGNVLGGGDHYLRYEPRYSFYWWPLDYTLFGLFRHNILRRWRLVFEHRISLGFTQTIAPVYGSQDRFDNPYIEANRRYGIGGYETLRGWRDRNEPLFPLSWRNGASHRILISNELRIPLEPSILWFVFFFDAGALFEDVNSALVDEQPSTIEARQSIIDSSFKLENLSINYYRYSWGFGFRLQIPVLPLRLYIARRVIWDPSLNFFKQVSGEGFEVEFGIGDLRF